MVLIEVQLYTSRWPRGFLLTRYYLLVAALMMMFRLTNTGNKAKCLKTGSFNPDKTPS